jgi:hypothetical protein
MQGIILYTCMYLFYISVLFSFTSYFHSDIPVFGPCVEVARKNKELKFIQWCNTATSFRHVNLVLKIGSCERNKNMQENWCAIKSGLPEGRRGPTRLCGSAPSEPYSLPPAYISEGCPVSVCNGVSLRASLRVDGASVLTLKRNSTFATTADNRWNLISFKENSTLYVNMLLK